MICSSPFTCLSCNIVYQCKFIHELTVLFIFQTNPLMLRVDTKSGHGSGKPTSKTIEEITDVYSFLVRSLNLEYKKGRTDDGCLAFTLDA